MDKSRPENHATRNQHTGVYEWVFIPSHGKNKKFTCLAQRSRAGIGRRMDTSHWFFIRMLLTQNRAGVGAPILYCNKRLNHCALQASDLQRPPVSGEPEVGPIFFDNMGIYAECQCFFIFLPVFLRSIYIKKGTQSYKN